MNKITLQTNVGEKTLAELRQGEIALIADPELLGNRDTVMRISENVEFNYINLSTGQGYNSIANSYKCHIYPKGTKLTIEV